MSLAQHTIQALANDYKLTPATLANRLTGGPPVWYPARHLTYISARVASALYKGNARIIISVPPRHGKSELFTKFTPIWALEKFPKHNVIITSYGAELSEDFGRAIRDLINEHPTELDTRIRADSSRVAKFQTVQGGAITSVGLGGAITGRGANLLIIDDYIKEIKEALSKAYRDYIWNWFTTTALTRLEPNGSVIIIATRWHQDDLIGRIVKNFAGEWDYIRIPAIAELGDPLGRPPGEALFPERYDIPALNERKLLLGTYFFNALFQQDPKGENSALASRSWIEVVDNLPSAVELKFARIWDFASTAQGGDYTVGTLIGWHALTNTTYIINVVRKQLSPNGVELETQAVAEADGIETKIYIEQEPGASGVQVIDHYKTKVLKDYKVEGIPSTTQKLVRAQPFLAACEAGKVKVLRGHWNEAFLEEFDDFPFGSHDDQVDTAAIGYTKLTGRTPGRVTWGRAVGTEGVKIITPNASKPMRGIVFGRR